MSLDDVLAELRKTYLEALPARAALIEKLLTEGRYAEVETEFHKLKGTGKSVKTVYRFCLRYCLKRG